MAIEEADADVIVIGAGLAGLRCARDLQERGLSTIVLESAGVVGGRVRTDHVDGFRLDRGFQLLNPAYPALRGVVDLNALALQSFGAGVAARTDSGEVRLGLPVAAPHLLAPTTAFAARHPRELLALGRWLAPLLRRPSTSLGDHLARRAAQPGWPTTLAESLDAAGAHGEVRRIVERFLSGVLLEDAGRTPTELVLMVMNSMLRGVPGLPRDGMQALPQQMAISLPNVHLRAAVRRVQDRGALPEVVTDSATFRGRAVVVAVDPAAAGRLLDLPTPRMRGVVTAWFAAEDDVPRTPLLHVDARRVPAGPLANAAVVSAAAPSYAPKGRSLVQASAVLHDDATSTVTAMRAHAGDLLGCDPDRWETLRVDVIPRALPDTRVPFSARRPVQFAERIFLCGDHRDTPSIQGALVSGRRAARFAAQQVLSENAGARRLVS